VERLETGEERIPATPFAGASLWAAPTAGDPGMNNAKTAKIGHFPKQEHLRYIHVQSSIYEWSQCMILETFSLATTVESINFDARDNTLTCLNAALIWCGIRPYMECFRPVHSGSAGV
jgi:hypothetical protein